MNDFWSEERCNLRQYIVTIIVFVWAIYEFVSHNWDLIEPWLVPFLKDLARW